ncbi:Glycosyltransferase, catalytic subunit of cellulose synthase and poly-beta-1,6-N-acetylglucosamine synthase [Filimonas lacunae]|uniref:Glycosyltransferase, catalytic subunit of cellulose synthase and poly-beta-1,6-N-acetylglucosamine synthase n=1 Tax=Filimonas lacunae TaxID=477680 RepID=A0A173MQJ2_9BACT|nr:polysaccharide deacetylase family protein [Filimonas lacunae]BAV09933.1 glycosyltransferase [Filimonas lacunae]SIS81294.1 Glycosyltransferase, catalytic subunit of cellulose synthase and poly-beta-1,6-N-acetylglucosamine synthase [Filimonas lacunae]
MNQPQPSAQIFQTKGPGRWQRFKWGGRIVLFLVILAGVVLYLSLHNAYMPSLPQLKDRNELLKSALQDKPIFYKESRLGKQYRGFRSFITKQWNRGNGVGQRNERLDLSNSPLFSDSLGVRAAFYVAWDAQSYFSLKRNISHVNLVIPEWFFLDANTDTLTVNIDVRAFSLIKKSGVKVMPMLTNFCVDKFRGDVIHRILHDPAKKARLINDISRFLLANHFQGINIDFEELQEETNEPLALFQQELYESLHSKGLMVTQDVAVFNEDYDYPTLAKYNDYLFLMAYDEFSTNTQPGPVSSQKWIEAAVDHIAKQVPSDKIVLCIAGYGYDWPQGKEAANVTFQEAVSIARERKVETDFDNNTYNIKFSYVDDNNVPHTVFATDAATNFNTLRFATEYGLAGTALWRLGSEDSRIWDFYDKPMTKAALRKFDFSEFSRVESSDDVDYIGEGEVLDVVATPRPGHISTELDTIDMLISEEHYDSLPSMYVVQKWGKPIGKKMVLTFDDGPDPVYTKQILDTLAKYKVPAAFFLVGLEAENNIPLVKRIFKEGHEIGNHTFTHPNMARVSEQRAFLEMDATRLLLECLTGRSTILFRAPYNADSEPETIEELVPVALSRTRNYLTIGESIDPNDWEASIDPNLNADTIFNRVVRFQDRGNVILLHDAGGPREHTVEALPRIIKYFRSKGYTFTTIADLLGKNKDELMPPVPKGSGFDIIQSNFLLVQIGYYGSHVLFALFIVFLILSTIRLLVMAVLAILQKRKEQKLAALPALSTANESLPLVSIIVPAYNEEVNAVSSLQNLLLCDYPFFEILFIDDGSKDSTYEKVSQAFAGHSQIKVFTKPNGGKASALNYGINQSHADFVVCIDADTQLRPDAVGLLMQHFLRPLQPGQPQMGAVSGTVKVGNTVNILTKWQSIEYITSQNFDRKAFAYINAITVVPGAIGAFRKDALIMAGGFTTDTLAEDCDITIRILKAGFVVANESKAYAYTEAPETLKQFMKQRFRWSFGVMQTVWKNKDVTFNFRYKSLGWLAFPDILLFKYVIPFFTPLADLLMIIGLFTENATRIGKYYLLFTVVDAAIALFAFSLESEKPGKLVWMLPQRLVYRWLLMVVLIRSLLRAVKGELQHWGVLKRTGNVKQMR